MSASPGRPRPRQKAGTSASLAGAGHMRMSNFSRMAGPTRPTAAARQIERERSAQDDRLDLAADGDREGVGYANHAPHPPPGGDRPQDRHAGAGDDVAEQVHEAADADRDAQQRVAAAGRQVRDRWRTRRRPTAMVMRIQPARSAQVWKRPRRARPSMRNRMPITAHLPPAPAGPGRQRPHADRERERVGERAVAVRPGPDRCFIRVSV